MAKKEKFIVTTPTAEMGYGHLRYPDTKFNPEGDYKQDFFLSAEDAKALCLMIESDPRAVVKGKKAKLKPTKVDGQFKFKTKQHAKVKSGDEVFEVKPRLYYIVDGKTVEYPDDAPTPYAGSKGQLELEVVPFEGFGGGLSLRLRAIRFTEIVEGSKGSSGNWDDVEEGYTSKAIERRVSPLGDEESLDAEDDVEENDDEEERW
jgi:hypothetical protein